LTNRYNGWLDRQLPGLSFQSKQIEKEQYMPNWCYNSLTVIGPEEQVAAFDAKHSLYIYELGVDAIESERKPGKSEYRYQTRWQPKTSSLRRASRKFLSLTFLISFMDFANLRGQIVIVRGEWKKLIHRSVYGDGRHEEHDQSHPPVDLFSNYLAVNANVPQPNEIVKVPVGLNEVEQQLLAALSKSQQLSTQTQ
jgi:hypothetical protein